MIAIIDYGSGNIQAIKNIYKRLNVECEFVSKPDQLRGAKKIVLAGVGAFDESMRLLNKSGMIDTLNDLVLEKKVPVLGICVGMQIMASKSEEGELPGLGWFSAEVKRFDNSSLTFKPKTPHMGWNTISPSREHQIFSEIDIEKGFYFLHSFYFDCRDKNDVLTLTNYGSEFASSVNKEEIFGFQFHPEKSHINGINLFKNFANIE